MLPQCFRPLPIIPAPLWSNHDAESLQIINSFINHTAAIALTVFIDVFFTMPLTTCFGPFGPSSGESQYITFSHTSTEN
jgi:hypothetical protein